MSGIIIPRTTPRNGGRTPTLVEYVERYLNQMRAPLKERTMFTRAGRTTIHDPGERIIYGPKGQKIRIVDTRGGTQVEHGNEHGRGVEHQHAHVRPPTATSKLEVQSEGTRAAIDEACGRQHRRPRRYFYRGREPRPTGTTDPGGSRHKGMIL